MGAVVIWVGSEAPLRREGGEERKKWTGGEWWHPIEGKKKPGGYTGLFSDGIRPDGDRRATRINT